MFAFYSERVLNSHNQTMLNTIIAKTLMELGEVSIIKKRDPRRSLHYTVVIFICQPYPTAGAVSATSLVSADAKSRGKL